MTKEPTPKKEGNGDPRWLDEHEGAAWRSLLVIINRAFPEIERGLRAHDLLGVHYHVLVNLSASEGRAMRLSELADTANISQSRLTHRLKVLVERGDVEIQPDPDDGRAKLATLTDAGLERLEAVAPYHVATVRELIFDHLPPGAAKTLADALGPVAQSLADHPEYLNPDC